MTLPFDLTTMQAVWIAAGFFIAAYVRGYSGFGMSALIITAVSLVSNPIIFVPVVLICDILLTAVQAPSIWKEIDWRRAFRLFGGALLGVPLGVWVLANVGVDVARATISLMVLILSAVLWAGWSLHKPAGTAAHIGIGVVSGVTNGAAIGGLPVAAFFAAQPMRSAAFRATMIAYFTLLDLWTVPLMAGAGMVTAETLKAVAFGVPFLVIGLWLGSKRFVKTEPASFRRFAILLLATLSIFGLLKSLGLPQYI